MDQFTKETQDGGRNQLNLLRMIESRIVEIIQIEKDVKKKYPKLAQQRLPRYMRRRAASHNPARIPSWLRCRGLKSKSRKKLSAYRRRVRFMKHKRILMRHARHRFKDPNKTLLHKWFAKRFKMDRSSEGTVEFVPLHNNTKNFRNLYRQTQNGCAFISMAHLVAIKVEGPYNTKTIDSLNRLTTSISGFTFAARSLEFGKYEVVIHLYDTSESSTDRKQIYLCPAIVRYHENFWTIWVPRALATRVGQLLDSIELTHSRINPRDSVRIRIVGPEAQNEALKIASDTKKHEEAIDDVANRLPKSFKFNSTIGRFLEEKSALFTYYQTWPLSVDVVFRNKRAGRLLWYNLVKNRAHLVGGRRDFDELLVKRFAESFQLKPDCD